MDGRRGDICRVCSLFLRKNNGERGAKPSNIGEKRYIDAQ
jgi:hypothetical protein